MQILMKNEKNHKARIFIRYLKLFTFCLLGIYIITTPVMIMAGKSHEPFLENLMNFFGLVGSVLFFVGMYKINRELLSPRNKRATVLNILICTFSIFVFLIFVIYFGLIIRQLIGLPIF